jgi:hypothetical protein
MIDIWRFFRYFLFCAKHDGSALGEYHAGTTTKPGRGQKKRDGGSFGAKDYMPKEELVTVLFTLKTLPPAQKELDKMDKDQVQKIFDHIEQLKRDPFR